MQPAKPLFPINFRIWGKTAEHLRQVICSAKIYKDLGVASLGSAKRAEEPAVMAVVTS